MQLDEFAIMGDAITVFGADAQQDKLLEEMAELQKEILKHRLGEDNLVHIAEEIADVEIMLDQVKMMFCCAGRVKAIRASKIRRLSDRIWETRAERAAEGAADPEEQPFHRKRSPSPCTGEVITTNPPIYKEGEP